MVIAFPGAAGPNGANGRRGRLIVSSDRNTMVNRLIDMAAWARRGNDAAQANMLAAAAWIAYDDRRAHVRVSVRRGAQISIGGIIRPLRCINLSSAGAKLKSTEPLPESGNVILTIRGLPPLTAKILQGGFRPRVHFIINSSDQQAALDLLLHARLLRPHQVRRTLNLAPACAQVVRLRSG